MSTHSPGSFDEVSSRVTLRNREVVEVWIQRGLLFIAEVRWRFPRRRALEPFYMGSLEDVDQLVEQLGGRLDDEANWFVGVVDALGHLPSLEALKRALARETSLRRANEIVAYVANRMAELESKSFLTQDDLGFDQVLAQKALSYMIRYWRRRPSGKAEAERAERLCEALRQIRRVPDEFRPLLDEANEIMRQHPDADSITANERMIVTAADAVRSGRDADARPSRKVALLAKQHSRNRSTKG